MRNSHIVMLVDDEPNIISSLQRLIHREGHEIITANSGYQALALLDECKQVPAVVVSDYRMPEMDGVRFLSLLRARYPDTVRIILSGYSDAEMAQSAIKEGRVYKFLAKPWDDDEIRGVIRSSIEHYESTVNARTLLERANAFQR